MNSDDFFAGAATTVATTRDPHAARMLARYGLKPSKAEPCLLPLLGKRCRRFSHRAGHVSDCPCEAYWGGDFGCGRLFDHVRMWRDASKRAVLTAEPYHLDTVALERLRADCSALGLEVDVADYSPWYPGWTTLVMVRARDLAP